LNLIEFVKNITVAYLPVLCYTVSKEGGDFIMTSMTQRKTKIFTLDDHIKAIEAYVEKVRREETPAQAKEALIRTGVLEKDGLTIAKNHRLERVE